MIFEAGQVLTSNLAHYTIESSIGSGGFGHTYRAQRTYDGETVVVKQMRMERVDDWKAVELFEREANVLYTLEHARIPRYIDFFNYTEPSGAATFVLIQSYVEGRTLRQLMRDGDTLTNAEMMRWFWQMLEVLDYLHALDPPVIHRDISPKNVMLTPDGDAMLIDFGTVQATIVNEYSVSSTSAGTFGYSPSEQFVGRATPSADLYALAVTYLSVTTGLDPQNMPFQGQRFDVRAALADHDLDARLLLSLEQMTETDPAHRPQTAAAVMRRIQPAWDALQHQLSDDEGEEGSTVLMSHDALARLSSVAQTSSAGAGLFESAASGGGGGLFDEASVEGSAESRRWREALERASRIHRGSAWLPRPLMPFADLEEVIISPDGCWMVLDVYERALLLDLRDGSLQTLFVDGRASRRGAFSADSTRLAIFDQYRGLHVIELDGPDGPTWTCVEVPGVNRDTLEMGDPILAISPDNRSVAICAEDEDLEHVFIIDWSTRSLTHTLDIPEPGFDSDGDFISKGDPCRVAFSSDGAWLLVDTTYRVVAFDAEGIGHNVERAATCSATSLDGRLTAFFIKDGEEGPAVVFGRASSLAPLTWEEHRHVARGLKDVYHLAFSPDGALLAVAHQVEEGDEWLLQARIYDTRSGQETCRIERYDDDFLRQHLAYEPHNIIGFTFDNRFIMSAPMEGDVFVFDPYTGEGLTRIAILNREGSTGMGARLIMGGQNVDPSALGITVSAPETDPETDDVVALFAATQPDDLTRQPVGLAHGFFGFIDRVAPLRPDIGYLNLERPDVISIAVRNAGDPLAVFDADARRYHAELRDRFAFWNAQPQVTDSRTLRKLVAATAGLAHVLPEIPLRAQRSGGSGTFGSKSAGSSVGEAALLRAAGELAAYSDAELRVIAEEMIARIETEEAERRADELEALRSRTLERTRAEAEAQRREIAAAEEDARKRSMIAQQAAQQQDLKEHERQRSSGLIMALDSFGLDEHNYHLLCLWPAVHVAWSDGKIQKKERKLFLERAQTMGYGVDSDEVTNIEAWLASPPEQGRFAEALSLLTRLSMHYEFEAVDSARLQEAVDFARDVAEAAGGFLGFGNLSKAEAALLDRLERELLE